MKHSILLLFLVGLSLLRSPAANAQSGGWPSADSEIVPFSLQTAATATPVPLSLDRADAFRTGRNVAVAQAPTVADLAAADANAVEAFPGVYPPPLRVGVVRPAGERAYGVEDGIWSVLPDGRRLWTLAFRASSARGLRLHFSGFDLGQATALVYALEGGQPVVRGPYSGRGPLGTGEFWTEDLPGDTAFIEVQSTEGAIQLTLDQFVYFDRLLSGEPGAAAGGEAGPVTGDAPAAQSGSGAELAQAFQPAKSLSVNELACHLDAMCYNNSQINFASRDAILQLNFMKGGGSFVCSGTLLADLDGATVVPYMLTAYHCLNTQAQVDTLVAVAGWQRANCGGSLPVFSTLPRLSGGTLLATNPTDGGNDMAFIRLNGSVPAGTTLAGWSLGTNIPGGAYMIHHPDGSFKRITFFNPSSYVFCSTGGGDYILGEATAGGVEGGSSGAGVFDLQGRLLGQLLGRCGPGTSEEGNCADQDGWRAKFGAFHISYNLFLRRWLEMGGTVTADSSYAGQELGSPTQPFRTVTAAYNFLWNDPQLRIRLRAGVYNETITFRKPVTLFSEGGTAVIGR